MEGKALLLGHVLQESIQVLGLVLLVCQLLCAALLIQGALLRVSALH